MAARVRRPIGAMLFTLALSASVAASPTPPQGNVSTWATATSTHATNGRVIVFRYAEAFRPGFERASLPDRVILVWRYQSPSGMPSASERAAMDQLEDALAPLTDQPGLAVLALVSTGENLREWIYYASSEAAFLTVLNQQLKRLSRFPIEVHAASDPGWESYQRFRAELRD